MTRLVKCNCAGEFNALMLHIFFDDQRAKDDSDEVILHDYETIQGHLGIAVEDHDDEVDLLQEFMAGNHKYANQTYPVYVEWEFTKRGCETEASTQILTVLSEDDISFSSFKQSVEETARERDEFMRMMKQINALKKQAKGSTVPTEVNLGE